MKQNTYIAEQKLLNSLIPFPFTWVLAKCGNSYAKFRMGFNYYKKRKPSCYKKAEYWLHKSVDNGCVRAIPLLATIWINNLDRKFHPIDKMVELVKRGAETGDEGSIEVLETLLEKGKYKGTESDGVQPLYKGFADKDNIAACRMYVKLRHSVMDSTDFSEDLLPYYFLLAEHCDAFGHFCLFRCYSMGMGVEQDRERAYKHLMIAVDGGCNDAICQMILLHMNGYAPYIKKDFKKLFKMASEYAGSINDAKGILGTCYFYGLGVNQDMKKGYELWMESVLSGSTSGYAASKLKTVLSDSSVPHISDTLTNQALMALAKIGDADARQQLYEHCRNTCNRAGREHWKSVVNDIS